MKLRTMAQDGDDLRLRRSLCGKAWPFRQLPFPITCFSPREGGAFPRRKMIMVRGFRPERRSLSAKQEAKPLGHFANLDSLGPTRHSMALHSLGPQQ